MLLLKNKIKHSIAHPLLDPESIIPGQSLSVHCPHVCQQKVRPQQEVALLVRTTNPWICFQLNFNHTPLCCGIVGIDAASVFDSLLISTCISLLPWNESVAKVLAYMRLRITRPELWVLQWPFCSGCMVGRSWGRRLMMITFHYLSLWNRQHGAWWGCPSGRFLPREC